MRFFSQFLVHRDSDGVFNKAFMLFLVYHKMDEFWDVSVNLSDEFSMLCMGGEL